MTQAYKKIMNMNISEIEEIEHPKIEAQNESEADELLGDLNPRYFEEVYNLDGAKQRAYSKQVCPDFCGIRTF
jgi:hypothetical protein